MKTIVNCSLITSTTYATLTKQALSTIGDLRAVETTFNSVIEEARRLNVMPDVEPDSELALLAHIANTATERDFDLRRKEALEATRIKADTLVSSPRRTFVGRILNKAADFVG